MRRTRAGGFLAALVAAALVLLLLAIRSRDSQRRPDAPHEFPASEGKRTDATRESALPETELEPVVLPLDLGRSDDALRRTEAVSEAPEEPAVEPPAEAANEPPETGRIRGQITYYGSKRPSTVVYDHAYGLRCDDSALQPWNGEAIPLEDLLVAPDGGLQNAVLFLDGTVREAEFGVRARVVDCRFRPRIAVMTPREEFPILDHTGPLDEHEEGGHTFVWPGLMRERKRELSVMCWADSEVECLIRALDPAQTHFEVRVDGHPWMVLHCLFDRRVYALTDAGGFFEFPGVVPGRYSLTYWHERLGTGPLVDVWVDAGQDLNLGAPVLE